MKRLLVALTVLFFALPSYGADVKISDLTEVTSPTTSTAVLPVVDGGVTKKVTIDNILKVGSVTQAWDADLTTLAALASIANVTALAGLTPTDQAVIGWNGTTMTAFTTHSHSDSAAQFYSATASKGTMKMDLTGVSDTILYTVKPIADANTTFSPGKTFTNGKWCSYATATGFTCNEDAPAGSGDITAVGSCTTGSCEAIGNGSTGGGYLRFAEDLDNGTDYIQLKGADDAGTNPSLTLSGSPANTEDLTIALGANDNKVTVSSSTGVTELNISAINLVTTGYIDGGILVTKSTDATITVSGMTGLYINADDDVIAFNLPATPTNKAYCFANLLYARAITVNPDDADYIVHNGITAAAGEEYVSSGARTDQVCVVGIDASYWLVTSERGTWAETSP